MMRPHRVMSHRSEVVSEVGATSPDSSTPADLRFANRVLRARGPAPPSRGNEVAALASWKSHRAAGGEHAQQQRADAVVSGGNEYHVADNHRVHGVDGILQAGAEPDTGVDSSVGGVERDQALAHQAKNLSPAVDGRGDRSGVTRL